MVAALLVSIVSTHAVCACSMLLQSVQVYWGFFCVLLHCDIKEVIVTNQGILNSYKYKKVRLQESRGKTTFAC